MPLTLACVDMSFDCLWAGTTFGRRGLRVLDDLLSNEFICPELVVEFIMVQLPWPAVRADLGINLPQEEEYICSNYASEMAAVSDGLAQQAAHGYMGF